MSLFVGVVEGAACSGGSFAPDASVNAVHDILGGAHDDSAAGELCQGREVGEVVDVEGGELVGVEVRLGDHSIAVSGAVPEPVSVSSVSSKPDTGAEEVVVAVSLT